MNKGIQDLAAEKKHLKESDEEFKMYRDKKYSLVQNQLQKQSILDRVDKNPKNFSPYDFDALYKIVLIGESNTGKTSMLIRFSDNMFSDNYLCTIGVDFKIKTLKVDNKIIKMQIWDTAGQERFRSISHAYYRNSHGCVAVYDITSRQSFESIEEQIQSFIAYSAQDVAKNIILVGNKSDLEEKRKVSFEEAVRLASKLNLSAVFETSAKDNNSIDDVFFRSIVNCVDFYNASGDEPLVNKSGRSRKFSAHTEIVQKKSSFKAFDDDNEDYDDLGNENRSSGQYSQPQIRKNSQQQLHHRGQRIRPSQQLGGFGQQRNANPKKKNNNDCCV